MTDWIRDNIASVILFAVVLIILAAALRSKIKSHKQGGCGCGCAGCSGCCIKSDKEEKNNETDGNQA
ncbi:FeoB-associated Cys-rich membrane protein [Ruminococcus sp. XPD3002]|uniref:FeoB-associated Cys-rich membrane protein n=1 Tax=Ruminococcus sp. XPD3002 TaxID=1452269 RepID=UPI000913B2C3|nr:Virus attachment protein p12 family protein [Ruminococcus flavefaciens]